MRISDWGSDVCSSDLIGLQNATIYSFVNGGTDPAATYCPDAVSAAPAAAVAAPVPRFQNFQLLRPLSTPAPNRRTDSMMTSQTQIACPPSASRGPHTASSVPARAVTATDQRQGRRAR